MILHCSKKLAGRLADVSAVPLQEDSPLGSWHGHLFTLDRRQCAMFCHDATRFTLFMAGLRKEQFAKLGSIWFRELVAGTLFLSGCADAQISKALLGPVRYDTATDRSVQGTMNIAKWDLDACLHDVSNVMDLDPFAMSHRLNQRPVTIRGKSLWPDRAMQEVVAAL